MNITKNLTVSETKRVNLMPYLTDLDWIENLDEFSEEEKKVMLALSHSKYRWRNRDRLLELTCLKPKRLDRTLAYLIADDLIRPAFSKKQNIVFGLKERVG